MNSRISTSLPPKRLMTRKFLVRTTEQILTVRKQNVIRFVRDHKKSVKGRRAFVCLPRPFREHGQRLELARKTKGKYSNLKYIDELNEDTVEWDHRLRTYPEGIIVIHLLEMEHISVHFATEVDSGAQIFYYCIVTVGNKRKMTRTVQSDSKARVRIDALLYFPVILSETRSHYRNKIRIEIWAFQNPNEHSIVGIREFHVYSCIAMTQSVDYANIWNNGIQAASLSYEWAFAYGAFGYGHSNQLQNKITSIMETVSLSMFPRIRLRRIDLVDNQFGIPIPAKLHMVGLSNFILYAPGETTKKKLRPEDEDFIEPKFFCFHHVEFERGQPVHATVNMIIIQQELEADFNELYGEYICIPTRKARLLYLHALAHGRLEDTPEIDVGTLFNEIDCEDAEEIMLVEENPAELIFPTEFPCTEYPSARLEPSDESLFKSFSSFSRSSGWLARLFGYVPKKFDTHFQEPDYPVKYIRGYLNQQKGWIHCTKVFLVICFKVCNVFRDLLHFIIPDLHPGESKLPIISVTLPTPQVSTTNLFANWINDAAEHIDSIVQINKAKDPVQQAYEGVKLMLYNEYQKEHRNSLELMENTGMSLMEEEYDDDMGF